ncbi:hypothetical protein [Halovivax limisalsi]|uniref:hypothetical protein n=1 Tax=Halovivax limisalsi TaxID=1453760 RepID=UPI001FFD12EA|nr:hypothetical protein [Halovivax limisalsi]
MAQDDTDRADELEAERAAEIEDELERVGRDPDEVDADDEAVGTQSAPRRDEEDSENEAE